MASIKKRPDGKWRARYRDENNKELARHFGTRAEARRWLDEVTTSVLTGQYVDPKAGRVTFEEYAERWRSHQIHRLGTVTLVEQQLRLHVYPTLGKRQMKSILPSDIQGLVRHLERSLAPSTIRVVYERIAAVFAAAQRDHVVAGTPCVNIKLPATRLSSMREVLTTEHVIGLSRAVPERYKALVITGAGTGLRPGELFGLTVDQVDFLRRTVRVDRQLVRVRGHGVTFGPPKSDTSVRTVPLADHVGEALAAHLATFDAHRDLGLIFTNARGAPIQQHPFAVLFERARESAEVPLWATPHDLRHYYASLLIQSGASIKAVQARLGHSSAKVTLDTYGHLWPEEEDRTRAAVDAEFGRTFADYPRTTSDGRPAALVAQGL